MSFNLDPSGPLACTPLLQPSTPRPHLNPNQLAPDSRYNQWAGCNATLSNATVATAWLATLGAAAKAAGVKLTYCMAWARMLLASTESEAVTTARASVDYYPNTGQWNIGFTSLLADSLGLRPSKDLWWSSNRGRVWSLNPRLAGAHSVCSARFATATSLRSRNAVADMRSPRCGDQ